MHRVTALYVRSDTVYRHLLFDWFDRERDARTYAGPWPVVAHPPCRAWSKLSGLAKPEPGESELAPYAVGQVRAWGGVLEHPAGSALWPAMRLPHPGEPADPFGGWSVRVNQGDYGHEADKPTLLYVVGLPRHHLSGMLAPSAPIRRRDRRRTVCELDPDDRESTPYPFACLLVGIAERCRVTVGLEVLRPDGSDPFADPTPTRSERAADLCPVHQVARAPVTRAAPAGQELGEFAGIPDGSAAPRS